MKHYIIPLLTIVGLLAACSPSVETASRKFNELPPAVQKTVRAQSPNSEIANVSSTTVNGMPAYEVQFRNPDGSNPKVVVSADGALISSDLSTTAGKIERALTPTGAVGTPFSALPEKAQKTIKTQAPNATIANISRQEENGRVFYTVEFEETGKNPTIRVAEDGTLVQGLQK